MCRAGRCQSANMSGQNCGGPRWSSQPSYSGMDALMHRFADQMKEPVCASAGVNPLVEDFLVPVRAAGYD